MKKLIISKDKFNSDSIKSDGIKYIIGNGYIGYRGTLDEMEKEDFVGVNLPNFYDQVDDNWTDSVNVFNPLYTKVYVNTADNEYVPLTVKTSKVVSHYQELNILTGVFTRKTIFLVDNKQITIESLRFVSINDYHYLGYEYHITANENVNVVIKTGIDTDIWSLHGNHLENTTFTYNTHRLITQSKTVQRKDNVIVVDNLILNNQQIDIEVIKENKKFLNELKLNLTKNKVFSFVKIAYIDYRFTIPLEMNNHINDYNLLKISHLNKMKEIWNLNYIDIEGEEEALLGINYSIYELLISIPRHANNLSIPARGLSSQVYKGAIFWDTEIFILPYLLNTDISAARSVIKYRIEGLEEAQKKAKEFGYEGAFYAWESIEHGYDACSLYNVTDAITNEPIRTYFKDKQIHISGDIVYGLIKYYERTHDISILIDGGLNVIYEVCKFYLSYLTYSKEEDKYFINDVIGPDEYHERVNNNAYTNMLVSYCFSKAIELTDLFNDDFVKEALDKSQIKLDVIRDVNNKLFIYQTKDGVIEQFSGYFDLENITYLDFLKRIDNKNTYLGGSSGLATPTQVIKQADVITMLYLFKNKFTKKELQDNFDYYVTRTEHGSSLSASMYSLVASLIGNPDYAYPYFLNSSLVDIRGKAKEYAGGVYIGGSHMASCGGAYMSLVYGFCGLDLTNGITLNPNFPKQLKKVVFKIIYNNEIYRITITKEKTKVVKERTNE